MSLADVVKDRAIADLGLGAEDAAIFRAAARIVTIPDGAAAIGAGRDAENYLFLVEGRVRMQLTGASGRSVVLFRVEPGEACVLTTSCLMSHRPYPVEGISEGEVRALLLPRAAFESLMACSETFRHSVLAEYGERVSDLLLALESTVFERIESRLARALLTRAVDGAVHCTHAEIADEIGSAREVVSRQLARFARRGLVALKRGEIVIRRPADLERIGATDGAM